MNVYPLFKKSLLSHDANAVDLDTDTIKVALLSGHTYDASDQFLSDVLADAGTSEIARSGALAGVTLAINGNVVNFDHADETIAAVPTGDTITDIIYFKDTGADGTSPVIAHIDQDDGGNPLSLPTNVGRARAGTVGSVRPLSRRRGRVVNDP